MILDSKSMSNDELRRVLTSATVEFKSRTKTAANECSAQHLYRVTMRRTPKAEPQRFGSC
jgi:hypothetical protein